MNRNTAFFLFALCPLIPLSAHFAWAVVASGAFLLLFVGGILCKEFVKWASLGEVGPYIELAGLAGLSSLLFLLFRLFFPILSVSLGMYFFLTSVSYLILVSIDRFSWNTPGSTSLLGFVPLMLLFSFLREILGFGMITLPGEEGLKPLFRLPGFDHWGLPVLGTLGGACVLLGLITWGFKYVSRRIAASGRNRKCN